MSNQLYQGDVAFVPLNSLRNQMIFGTPTPIARPSTKTGIILHTGEKEGHNHVLELADPSAVAEVEATLSEVNGRILLTVPASGAKVTHPEHNTLTLEPSETYVVVPGQRELNPLDDTFFTPSVD